MQKLLPILLIHFTAVVNAISSPYQFDNDHIDLDSALIVASKQGNIDLLNALIDQGANIEHRDESGYTPLQIAVINRQTAAVESLISKGAKVDAKQKGGLEGTALMFASSHKNLAISRLLIKAGADINAVDKNLDPALNWATYGGNIIQMKFLINNGADLSLKSKHGDAADVALRLWHADSVVDVFRTTNLYEERSRKEKQMLEAVFEGDIIKVKQLLSQGISPDTKDGLNIPILQIAAQSGNLELTKLLLENGSDPNQLNRVGQSPLAFAARFGQNDIVSLLLNNGADVNATDDHYKLTPLIGAAINGDVEIGQKLIKAGAKIDHIETVNQCAALHWALFYESKDFVEMLLKNGADYNMEVLDGQYSARSLARNYGYNEIVNLIDSQIYNTNRFIGSWVFKEIHYIYADTTYKISKAFPGTFIITPVRYAIMYNPTNSPRKPFVNLSNPTKEEVEQAFQSIVFNSGQYTISDSTLINTPDIARVPGFEGGKQYYQYEIDKQQLRLTLFDETYPDGSKPAWYGKLEILFILERE